MKKFLAIALVSLMIFGLVSCDGLFDLGKDDESTEATGTGYVGNETGDTKIEIGTSPVFAAVPVAPQNNELKVIDSYTQGEKNYYLLDAGYIKNVYISTLAAVSYTGVPISSSKTTYSSSEVSKSISTTVVNSYSHTNTHSTHTGIGFEEKVNAKFPFVGNGELTFNQEFSWDWSGSDVTTNEKSVSDTTETAKTYAEEQTISFDFGFNEVPEGYYRYAMYGICDVYYMVVTNTDNTTLESCSITTCARPDSFFIRSEYSADGNFDNTPEKEIVFAPDFYKSLPIPTATKPVNNGQQTNSNYDGGSGTESDPYLIATKEQFTYMVNNCDENEYYKLTSDLALGNWSKYGILSWNKNSRTAPKYFTGNLDGDGHKVTFEVTINRTTKCSWALGLFPATKNATINNLDANAYIHTEKLDGIDDNVKWDISNDNCASDVMVGGIVGYANATSIINCSVEGNIYYNSDGGQEDTCVGGVVGHAYQCPVIRDCSSSADVYARGFWVWVGGVISTAYKTTYGNLSFTGETSLNEDWLGGGSSKNDIIVNDNKVILNLE